MEFKKNPTIKLTDGPKKVVFKKLFKEGTSTFDGVQKAWHGYEIDHEGTIYSFFASDSVHDLFNASGVGFNRPFIIEFSSYKNSEGKFRNQWTIDGKNIWKYQDEAQSANDEPKSTQATPEPDPGAATSMKIEDVKPEPITAPGSIDQPKVEQQNTFNEKNDLIKGYIEQVKDLLQKIEDETTVPF